MEQNIPTIVLNEEYWKKIAEIYKKMDEECEEQLRKEREYRTNTMRFY